MTKNIVSVICVAAVEACKFAAIAGSAGRYMSTEKGPKIEIAPSSSSTLEITGGFTIGCDTVTGSSGGDSVTLTFNYRFLVAPTNINAGLRSGLYNSNGTRQTNDASDTTVPGPGTRISTAR